MSTRQASIRQVSDTSYRALLAAGRHRLKAAGIETADLDAHLLLMAAAGMTREALFLEGDRQAPDNQARRYRAWIGARAKGAPVARLTGERAFWGLSFHLSPATLEPRPDSETLIRAALSYRPTRDTPLIADFGTGTGCLLLSLLYEWPEARGIGIDIQEEATRTAQANAARLGLGGRCLFVTADWGACLGVGKLDLILTNPPYIASGTISTLEREVQNHDPRIALDGGADGLSAYRTILMQLTNLLRPDGTAILEIGYDQAHKVTGLAENAELCVMGMENDLAGRTRVLIVKKTV